MVDGIYCICMYTYMQQSAHDLAWLPVLQNLDDALKELEEVQAQSKLLSPAQLECASDPWREVDYASQAPAI